MPRIIIHNLALCSGALELTVYPVSVVSSGACRSSERLHQFELDELQFVMASLP